MATTSNGEPPPESEFDSWLLPIGALLGSVTSVGAALVGSPEVVDVVSRFRPEDDDALEG